MVIELGNYRNNLLKLRLALEPQIQRRPGVDSENQISCFLHIAADEVDLESSTTMETPRIRLSGEKPPMDGEVFQN